MTVQAANPPFNEYTAAPGATVFAYKFKVIRSDDLTVMVDGMTKTIGTDYSLSGVGANDGGDVTFLAPMVGGELVVARMDMSFDRQTDYQQNGDFLSPTVNNDFDRLWLALQQLGQSILSCIKLPFTTTTDQSISQSAAERANTVLAFDASGNLTVSTTDAANVAAAQAAADAAAASAASVDPSNLVHRSGAETVDGIKTFTASPLMPLAAAADETQKAATTAFVRGKDFGLAFSVAGNALTVALKRPDGVTDPSATNPVYLDFRSSAAAGGGLVRQAVTAAAGYTITGPLGSANGVAFKSWVVAFDDGGTVRIGVINCLSGQDIYPLSQFGLASSSAAAASAAQIFYTGTAVAAKAYVVLGYFSYETGVATAGTYVAVPTRAQVFGAGVPLPGTIVNVARSASGAVATGTTVLPVDDTIPQITEGDQYMAKAITPSSAANVLQIDAELALANGTGTTSQGGLALFQDAVANALAARVWQSGGSTNSWPVGISHRMLAGTTSATTMRVRAGQGSAGSTVTFNGASSARLMGGVMASNLTIQEIAA